jgi:hypothetical protein
MISNNNASPEKMETESEETPKVGLASLRDSELQLPYVPWCSVALSRAKIKLVWWDLKPSTQRAQHARTGRLRPWFC